MSCRDGKLHNHKTADFGAKSADYCASALSIENAGNIGDHGTGKNRKTLCFFFLEIGNFNVPVLFSHQHETKTFSILNFGYSIVI